MLTKMCIRENTRTRLFNPTEVFDFSMVKQVKVNVDYGFTNDYYVIFGLYDQNPLKEVGDSWVKDETLAPVYSASTDKKVNIRVLYRFLRLLRRYGFIRTI
ncbi:MAG: hypothetical protein ACLUE2_16560 [Bacteroides cellulosilyticus]